MIRTPRLLLGVDTGGTYTDAVLLDAADRSVVASAKALTTRGDLAIGISNAIADVADGIDPGSVELVSVSTTLATNAVVEGHGSSVLVVLAGFDQAMVERSGISSAFSDVVIETIAGGHNHYGDELQPLDLDQLGAVLNIHGGAVRAVAVASAFAVRNNAHELAAREHITAMTELPTTISSELSASLDAPRRALTAVLNARLLSKIADLIAAVRRSLDQIGVQAPVMIAKGDGSLAVADSLAQRPIETILSGPAASMVGAGVLSGLDDFILSDIGGTTTDVGTSIEGRPVLAPDGAVVGGWRTMVQAIDVRTTGLGGDSGVDSVRATVTVGPHRLVPVSLLGAEFDQLSSGLAHELSDPPSRDVAGRFVLLPSGGVEVNERMSSIEQRVFERVADGPTPLRDVAPGVVDRRALGALVERGYVQVAGFTPSDAAHVLGLQDNWDRTTAQAAAELAAWYTGLSVEEFCQAVWSETVRRSCAAVLEVAFGDDLGSVATGRDSVFKDRVVNAAIDGTHRLGGVQVRLSPDAAIVAVGGPAGVYYPGVAERLDAKLIIPDRFEVANAVGAAAGFLVGVGGAEVHLDGPGLFRVIAPDEVSTFTDAAEALSHGRDHAEAVARATLAELAGGLRAIGDVELQVDVERHDEPDATGDSGLYFARVRCEARARPYA